MNTFTVTNARSNLFNILKDTIKGHRHIKISSKDGNVVLLSESEYEGLLETAELLSVDGLKDSIVKADKEIAEKKFVSLEEAFQ